MTMLVAFLVGLVVLANSLFVAAPNGIITWAIPRGRIPILTAALYEDVLQLHYSSLDGEKVGIAAAVTFLRIPTLEEFGVHRYEIDYISTSSIPTSLVTALMLMARDKKCSKNDVIVEVEEMAEVARQDPNQSQRPPEEEIIRHLIGSVYDVLKLAIAQQVEWGYDPRVSLSFRTGAENAQVVECLKKLIADRVASSITQTTHTVYYHAVQVSLNKRLHMSGISARWWEENEQASMEEPLRMYTLKRVYSRDDGEVGSIELIRYPPYQLGERFLRVYEISAVNVAGRSTGKLKEMLLAETYNTVFEMMFDTHEAEHSLFFSTDSEEIKILLESVTKGMEISPHKEVVIQDGDHSIQGSIRIPTEPRLFPE